MKNSRKRIIAQIAQMDKVLQGQKKELTEHKEYFVQSKLTHYHLVIVVLIASAFFIGWKTERKQWGNKVMQVIEEVGTLAFLNYFKKMLFVLLSNNQEDESK
ncbi:hypothetical protein [Legionella sainthelensi]|uniref:hypothetical protein n=1 Tax=Legionella sainthelensi TaxID=28087 RepID=UPI000E20AE1E|nr:hypothetical protein [Legionella sainthelensi]